ncbi:MAG: 50S ribosomal protein L25 [bacterium]|nr:50S ribosomal protein L25 [bacterium]MDT8395944.1 50S ribosomal protein L25 [bacterium]
MTTIKIVAEAREDAGKGTARKLRQSGRIPAVLYGQGKEGLSLTLDAHEINKLLAGPGARTKILELEVMDEGKESFKRNILIKEIQRHPYREEVLHMDLFEVAMDQELSVMVPIETVGTPRGVKMGGILEMKRRQLEVFCLPGSIPHTLTVDISDLEIGDVVHVASIDIPEGVRIPYDTNFTILTVVGVTEEPEAEELEEGEVPEEGAAEAASKTEPGEEAGEE